MVQITPLFSTGSEQNLDARSTKGFVPGLGWLDLGGDAELDAGV
jgi:hypothetical protein